MHEPCEVDPPTLPLHPSRDNAISDSLSLRRRPCRGPAAERVLVRRHALLTPQHNLNPWPSWNTSRERRHRIPSTAFVKSDKFLEDGVVSNRASGDATLPRPDYGNTVDHINTRSRRHSLGTRQPWPEGRVDFEQPVCGAWRNSPDHVLSSPVSAADRTDPPRNHVR